MQLSHIAYSYQELVQATCLIKLISFTVHAIDVLIILLFPVQK